jgi:hypothetical protein
LTAAILLVLFVLQLPFFLLFGAFRPADSVSKANPWDWPDNATAPD